MMKNILLCFLILLCHPALAQEKPDQASVGATIGEDGTGKIIVEARGQLPKPPVFYSSQVTNDATVRPKSVDSDVTVTARILQGDAETISYWTHGLAEISAVEGPTVQAWSVRWDAEKKRYVDIQLKKSDKPVQDHTFKIRMTAKIEKLPSSVQITNLAPADDQSAGFSQVVNITYANGVAGRVVEIGNFLPVEGKDGGPDRFQTSQGGKLVAQLNRSGSSPAPVELSSFQLVGTIDDDGKSGSFKLRGTATVSKANATITVLSGNAAVSEIPSDANYRVRLNPEGATPIYELVFDEPGEFPIALDFVTVVSPDKGWKILRFNVATGAVAPLLLKGLKDQVEFRDNSTILPEQTSADTDWRGFIPANGAVEVAWKESRQVGEGKLFYSTSAQIETMVGAGLLRQNHQIDYQILQGELDELSLALHGPGEVLAVEGTNVVGWAVEGDPDLRFLRVRLSQSITESAQLKIRTQLALDAFPVRVEGVRFVPDGAVRHSGFIRLSNQGSVRLEPAGLTGLTQLAPEQYPGSPLEARQVFVYRFPAEEYGFEVAADRIQPETNVSELILYRLAETDRVISADIELDIREAPIREWDLLFPDDYSVVAVTGATVADYITATESEDGGRNLKIIFNADVSGRQLVSLQLEKNVAAAAGEWILPRLEYPDAESVRGDIGIVGAPGFRIAVGSTDLLAEKPLSYFPKPVPNLQQAFRIREPGWSATMQIELLDKSVQSDVFHLYSLSEGTAYGSVLINYFVTGAPVSELKVTVPSDLGNVMADGKDVRSFRQDEDVLTVSLHQPVIGPYTLLITFEEKLDTNGGTLQPGRVTPLEVQGERGFLQIVSPMQVKTDAKLVSEGLLKLDALELPAEFRLLSAAPSLGSWQYTERPFELTVDVHWYEPGNTVTQVVEFSEINSRISPDGELVTDVIYYVKSRGRRGLKLELPDAVRLWAVTVAGESVTARQTETGTLIPVPGGTDPNNPVEVRLRLGRPAVDGRRPVVALPRVDAPVLKSEWNIRGDEKHILVPVGGTVEPSYDVLRPSGFSWVTRYALGALTFILVSTGLGIGLTRRPGWLYLLGTAVLFIAVIAGVVTALRASHFSGSPNPLQLSLPSLTTGEAVEVTVRTLPLWQANLSWTGLIVLLLGIAALIRSFLTNPPFGKFAWQVGAALLLALGVLLQRDGASWFFGLLSLALLLLLVFPKTRDGWKAFRKRRREKGKKRKAKKASQPEPGGPAPGSATAILIGGLVLCSLCSTASAQKLVPQGYQPADEIRQEWTILHEKNRLLGEGTLRVSGKPGQSFLLLRAPAVLTDFSGDTLRLTRQQLEGLGLCYIVTIPQPVDGGEPAATDDPFADIGLGTPESAAETEEQHEASFSFHLEVKDVAAGFVLPTGPAAVQAVEASYDREGWSFTSAAAVKIAPVEGGGKVSAASLLLSPQQKAMIHLKPMARDVTTEETQFFVEAANLYLPGPGVVDGRHRIDVRPAQGQVTALSVKIPEGLTVSEVTGPIGSWQFDAESGALELTIEPAQSASFSIDVSTQRGLDPLPAEVTLEPLRIAGAAGEVGLVALAFGPDAQPEKAESDSMSTVNLGDFDASLLPGENLVLHRVYRYGAEGGSLDLRVAPVAPEIRMTSKQVISLGDERVVLGVNFATEITRAGLFQLSFDLPAGFEVESLSGDALHHWAELSEGEQRQIILHLNGKTIGVHNFALTLTSSAPPEDGDWEIPTFEIKEASRQTGELVVKPTTGIRLRTISRQNVSEIDPRSLGDAAKGSLAFRLLQRDWNLVLGIEKLDPWVTGQVLHEVTLREGQTRTALISRFNVQNASVRSLLVSLPVGSEDEIKTLVASGKSVSDLVRTAPDSDTWEIQFKRRVVGEVDVRIEYERRGDRANETEILTPAGFPEARQLGYYFAVRSGGRLELQAETFPRGWQRADWNTVPQVLREAGNRNAPVITLRTVSPEEPLEIAAQRHSLAEALKLRVAKGALTSVLSPLGDQITAVDLTMEVIQRSSLTIGLPSGGELFSVFVNGESVHSVRQGDAWQFHILPGANDRTANVRFVYSVPGDRLRKIGLASPQLNVPLENIAWNVVAPKGFELTSEDGNLELKQEQHWQVFDRKSYLSKAEGQRREQAEKATELLEQANDLLQAGEQSKARWALNSVANQYALDAASNEDARVQLENLQTQQAVVGLNTRRQRLFIDSGLDEDAPGQNAQIQAGITENRILQQGDLNYRPQELSQLLQGNTSEDNAALQRIAARLVQHQRTTVPAPQAITITLPEEGTVYTFHRTVQVSENAPLALQLKFAKEQRLDFWKSAAALLLLAALAAGIVFASRQSA